MSKPSRIRLSVLTLLFLVATLSASAQAVVGEFVPDLGVDLSGNWNPLLHEDFLERISRTRTGQLLRTPHQRQQAVSGRSPGIHRVSPCQSISARWHVAPYIYRGPLQLRIWDEKDPQSQRILAIKAIHQYL